MKKGILLFTTLLGLANLTFAQKLALYEEFSGENCGPCASLNPALMTLLNAAGNDTKVLLLKYQSPIPSAGPIYNVNTVFTDARMDYYAVNFAPYGRINGKLVGTGQNAGNISLTTQAMINSAAAETTPFTISVGDPVYSADGQSFTATITVTSNAAVTVSNAKLRVALAEELNYTTAPGNNGETHFENVVRQMYPNANGQALDAAWTAGQVRTYTISGAIPYYVKATAPKRFLAAFIQKDDNTKEIMQAAKTGNITIQLPQADAALTGLTITGNMKCQVPATINGITTILKNTGTATLTTAKIYYKEANAASWTEYDWTGTLAAGQTANVTLPDVTISTAGQTYIIDSVALPNGKQDLNDFDNVRTSTVTVLNATEQIIPLSNDLETENNNWVSYTTSGGYPIVRANSGTNNLGYNNSQYLLRYPNYDLPSSVQPGYYIFPKTTLPAGAKALDFYVSYAQYVSQSGAISGDRLEVVYSTDCGATWTRVWMQEKAELATVPPNGSAHRPTGNSSWALKSVDMTNVPTGAYIAFRATSGYGNELFIDNISLRTGAATGIDDVLSSKNISLFPNPVTSTLNVAMEMKKTEKVIFSVVNTLGQEVLTNAKDLNAGKQNVTIETANLAAGMYILNIKTNEGSTQQKFIKQ